jgi:hypothetical protein
MELACPLGRRIRARWVWNKGYRYFVCVKLDSVKVEWIVRQKEEGALTNRSEFVKV